MALSTWLMYVLAVLVLTVTPGPSVLACVSTAVQSGRRAALVTAVGSTSAIVGLMALSALGLGAVLAASDVLFGTLKWLGTAYLAYLGLSALLKPDSALQVGDAAAPARLRQQWLRGFLVGASNPKALLFFGALFPQFINLQAAYLPQCLILGSTFVFFEMLWLTIYACSAEYAKVWLQQPRRARWFNRLTGVVFLGAAAWVASSRRAAV